MLSRKEALRRVTPHWMELASWNIDWRDARYPLAKLMVEEGLTPWRAAVRWAPHDPRSRSVKQLSRVASQVMEEIMRAFGEELGEDPVTEMLVRLDEEGEVWVPMLYWQRVRETLEEMLIQYETEEGVKVTLTGSGRRLPARSTLELASLTRLFRPVRW